MSAEVKKQIELVGVAAASQPWILAGERSSLLTRIAATESVFVVRADEKLTAFVEVQWAIRGELA